MAGFIERKKRVVKIKLNVEISFFKDDFYYKSLRKSLKKPSFNRLVYLKYLD